MFNLKHDFKLYSFEWIFFLSLVFFAIGSRFVKSPFHLSNYSSYAVSQTQSCDSNLPSPQSFDVSEKNGRSLQRNRFLRVLLHQEEGCIHQNQILPLASIVRDHEHHDVIVKRTEIGKTRIKQLYFVPYSRLAAVRHLHLQKKLGVPENQLEQKSFYLIDIELLREDSTQKPDLESESEPIDDLGEQ